MKLFVTKGQSPKQPILIFAGKEYTLDGVDFNRDFTIEIEKKGTISLIDKASGKQLTYHYY